MDKFIIRLPRADASTHAHTHTHTHSSLTAHATRSAVPADLHQDPAAPQQLPSLAANTAAAHDGGVVVIVEDLVSDEERDVTHVCTHARAIRHERRAPEAPAAPGEVSSPPAVMRVIESSDEICGVLPAQAGMKRGRAASVDAGEVAAIDAGSQSRAVPAAASIAPIFRLPGAVGRRQRLLLVRHGRTIGYHVRDTPLAESGRKQAATLFDRFHADERIDAIVSSPLTRALQTFLLAYRADEHTHAEVEGAAPDNVVAPRGRHVVRKGAKVLPVYITALAREKLTTLGDTGRDLSDLLQAPALRPVHDVLRADVAHERWWSGEHEAFGRTSAPLPKSAAGSAAPAFSLPRGVQSEAVPCFRRRVDALRAYLRQLPHATIVIFGHAHLFRELEGAARIMDFCEVREMLLM